MIPKIGNDWDEVLKEEFQKDYFQNLMEFVEEEYNNHQIFPAKENIFHALQATPYHKVKAVIIGQDPYHDIGQAHGLCFSVQKGVKLPPSLKNIYTELHDDIGFEIPEHGCLESWANEGVLLLNDILTVRAHEAFSHKNKGWEKFTGAVIDALNKKEEPVVFLLWGKPAQKNATHLNNPNHLILEAPHPSPLSSYRGFFGCKHFSKCNSFLTSKGVSPINWQIE